MASSEDLTSSDSENEKNNYIKNITNTEEFAIDFNSPPILSRLPNQFVRVKNIRRTKKRHVPSKEFLMKMFLG